MKTYKGERIGKCLVTLKVDGVRCEVRGGVALSRAGKPLYGIPPGTADGTYEVFTGDWEGSVSACRTKASQPVPSGSLYMLSPTVDQRLSYGEYESLEEKEVLAMMAEAVRAGYEGLVIRETGAPMDAWYKVKPVETYDVEVTGGIEGEGRNAGRLGAFVTPMGNVGIGLTDSQRSEYWPAPVGMVIEVRAMELTPSGKFRHPRFVRARPDKAVGTPHPNQNPVDFITDRAQEEPEAFESHGSELGIAEEGEGIHTHRGSVHVAKERRHLNDDPALFRQLRDFGVMTSADFISKTDYFPPARALHNVDIPKEACYWCFVHGKCADHVIIDGDHVEASRRKLLNIGPYRMNKAKCAKCGDEVRSYHQHDFKYCSCMSIFVDGGSWCPRQGGNAEDFAWIKVEKYED